MSHSYFHSIYSQETSTVYIHNAQIQKELVVARGKEEEDSNRMYQKVVTFSL